MIPALFIVIIILIIVIMVKSSNEKDYKEQLGRKDWDLNYAQERIAAYQKQEDVLKKSKESLDAAINDFHKKQDAFWEDANQELQKKRNEVLKECEIYWEKIDKKIQAKQEQLKKGLWENCQKYMEDKAVSMPWLAAGMADFMTLQEDLVIQELESGNNRRDWDRAIKINDLKKEKKALIKENKLLRYQIEYFKQVIPEIEDLEDFDYVPVQYDDNADEIKQYLSDAEYNELSDCEKNQLALDRYWKRKKSKWEIGRDFERYYGYLLENMGYDVTYFGIDRKFEDLGRDLIAENNKHILIVQCKYWSKNKEIHEKHICQLCGSALEYKIACNPSKEVIPIFVTHTNISDKARAFAHALNVAVKENVDLKEYPAIKCNITTGIYHLPMDQQYDNFEVKPKRGDCYALTTQEAELLGCRRAKRWFKQV